MTKSLFAWFSTKHYLELAKGIIKMRKIVVTPHVGLGSLKLGMSSEQILDAIKSEMDDLNVICNRDIQVSEDKEDDGYTLRYIIGSFFFMVRYRNDIAIEISVDRELGKGMNIVLYDVNVFNTPVEDLVNYLKRFDECIHDTEDEQLSTNYEFNGIGICLWREEPFHEKLLLDQAYVEKMSLVIEEMYRYLYFDTVTVKE